jgi:hypothetical protein
MNKKQTAVEWFNQQLVDRQNGNGDSRSIDEIFEKAKEMFEEQIKNACQHGVDYDKSPYNNAQEYYNETYGKKG